MSNVFLQNFKNFLIFLNMLNKRKTFNIHAKF